MESQFIFILIVLAILIVLKLFVHNLKFNTVYNDNSESFRGGGGGGRGGGGMGRSGGSIGGGSIGGGSIGRSGGNIGGSQFARTGNMGRLSSRGGMVLANRNLNNLNNLSDYAASNYTGTDYADSGNYDQDVYPTYILPSNQPQPESQPESKPELTPEMKEKIAQMIQARLQQN